MVCTVFQKLIYPTEGEHAQMPTSTLLLFNCADWLGILVSIPLIDALGRKGFFGVGFATAAIMWIALSYVRLIAGIDGINVPDPPWLLAILLVIGSLGSATRGFAPEASNLWALEVCVRARRVCRLAAC